MCDLEKLCEVGGCGNSLREGRNIILRSQSIEFSDSFCLRILLINIAIESVHCDYERNVC